MNMGFKIPSWNPFRRNSCKGESDQSFPGVRVGAGKDYFEQLSDKLIVSHILDKISDAESLCRLSMVSKRMASLVFQAETVSVKIPCWGGGMHKAKSTVSVKTPRRPGSVHKNPFRRSFWGKLLYRLPSLPLLQRYKQYPPAARLIIRLLRQCAELYFGLVSRRLKFLGKFTAMRSLSVEYDCCCSRICSRNNNESPMVKFRIGPNSGTVLVAGGVEFLDDFDVGVQEYQNINRDWSEEELASLLEHVIMDIGIAAFGMKVEIEHLLINYAFAKGLLPSLQNVVVGDRTHGKIVIGERDVAAMRNMKGGKRKHSEAFGGKDFSVRFAPVLKLPPGCVMTTVALITVKDKDLDTNDDDAGDELLMMKEGFAAEDHQGDEEAYVKEAALAMLKEELILEGSSLAEECTFKRIKLDCLENLVRRRV